jgi:hypothetical protein
MVAAWIGAVVYFKIVDSMGDKKKGWDLWSWSCHKRTTKDGGVAWNALCIENVCLSLLRTPWAICILFELNKSSPRRSTHASNKD